MMSFINCTFHHVYGLRIRARKFTWMRCTGHVACIAEVRHVYGKYEYDTFPFPRSLTNFMKVLFKSQYEQKRAGDVN
jgi:hypothetical protein